MAFLGTLLIFAGYTLVYGAVAKGGRFATDPWAGLYLDAYTSTVGTAISDVAASSGVNPDQSLF
jgi:hypothetical protein